jgi:nitrogen regulatory protein P-II 1
MKEVKAFIRHVQINNVIKGLRDNDFKSLTLTDVEGTGRFTRRDDKPSFKFPVAHTKMAKLEIICKKEDVEMVVRLIHEHGGTGEKGDGIIYVSDVEQIFKVKTGEESQHEL